MRTLSPGLLCWGLIAVLSLLFIAGAHSAITPWSLVINTNNIMVVTNATYGAIGDGVSTNTTAIQNAINAAAKGGVTNGLRGGTVEIPAPGVYLCGPLNFSNNVNLQIDAGAIIRLLPYGSWPGEPYTGTVLPLINGSGLTNIAVTGSGLIDGQGAPWWLTYATNNRPLILSLSSCSEVLLENFTSSNPPVAHIALKGANAGNINIIGVRLIAPDSSAPVNPSHNTDGCDFAETNALFQDCVISTGDDNIAIGSSGSVSRDILVTNCFFGYGHGLSIGSFTSSGVSNLTVISCSFSNTGAGIKIKSERNRGGIVQNLGYYNLTMTNVPVAIMFYAYYEFGQGTLDTLTPQFLANYVVTNANPVPYEPPIYRNITISNVVASVANAGQPPVMFLGLPDHPITNVVIQSLNLTTASANNCQFYGTTNVQFINCTWSLPRGVRLQFWNAHVIFSNSVPSTNLLILDGLTTNNLGNTLEFDNAPATIAPTNAIAGGLLSLAGTTFTVSNNLQLTASTPCKFTLGTNTTRVTVIGNLFLGGTNFIFAGPGFTNGTYTLFSYTGNLGGTPPVLGSIPAGYNYALDTSTAGQVNLIVILLPPTNFLATATNLLINLSWNSVTGANNYNLRRGTVNGGPYPTLYSGLLTTNFADAAVTNATTYYYVVTAVGAGGESTNSSQASAIPLPSNQPTNVFIFSTNGQMQLSWPQDHLGWRLQIQTNTLNAGLGGNWIAVPASTNTTTYSVPIIPSNQSVFLRLIYP